jgi:hypothetical protein
MNAKRAVFAILVGGSEAHVDLREAYQDYLRLLERPFAPGEQAGR